MLRVLSLNLNYRVAKHGEWALRRDLIVDAARRSDADVLALQAVERAGGMDRYLGAAAAGSRRLHLRSRSADAAHRLRAGERGVAKPRAGDRMHRGAAARGGALVRSSRIARDARCKRRWIALTRRWSCARTSIRARLS